MPEGRELTRVHELIREMRVAEAMTCNVVTVAPETPMSELRDLLRSNRISGVPVVDGDKVEGIISIEDFIKWLSEGSPEGAVHERMTRETIVAQDSEPLLHAVRRIEDRGFGRLPVLDAPEGRLVGVISKGDIVEGLLKKLELDYHEEELQRYTGDWLFDDIIADRAGLDLEYQLAGGDVRNAGSCSSRLRKTLKLLGLHPDPLRRIAITAYEAEMNVAIYTDGGRMNANVTPREVVIVVADHGPGIADVKAAMRPGYSTAPEWVRELGFGAGMGLHNIETCADEVKLTSEVGVGTRLEARITVDGAAT